MGTHMDFWAGLVICAFVLIIDSGRLLLRDVGRQAPENGIQPPAADWKGKLFYSLGLGLGLGIVPLCRSLAVFLLGVFRLGLFVVSWYPSGGRAAGDLSPPFPPFLGKGESLVALSCQVSWGR